MASNSALSLPQWMWFLFFSFMVLSDFLFLDIVLFMGVCLVSPTYCIVTEYMHRGSLFDVIHNEKVRLHVPLVLSISLFNCFFFLYFFVLLFCFLVSDCSLTTKDMLSDILKGLYFIHSSGLIHRDFKYVQCMRKTS